MSTETFKAKYLLIVIALSLTACTKPNESERLLKSQGMTDISITGYEFFGCSEDDTYKTGFTATSVTGDAVSGVVCAGLFFKGATIRYN